MLAQEQIDLRPERQLKSSRLAIPAPSPAPRIFLAALGPRMCELAGKVADDVLLNWIPPSAVPVSLRHAETGAKRAGRSPADVDVAVYVQTCVTASARRWRGISPAMRSANAYARFFAKCGVAEEVEAMNAAWKAGDRTAAVRGITERVLDGLGAHPC